MLEHRDISNFFVAGINYKKSDASARGAFAVSNEQYENILINSPKFGVTELFVLSTCNRTEIFGFCENAQVLALLLCSETEGSLEKFMELAYIKNCNEAITHLFNVGAGLDSQILGDYEIVGQLKQAVKFSKERNCIGAYLERMLNAVFQSSKEIKTTTSLSGGTVSVSFAAVQFIKETIRNIPAKNILLLGTGKIGRNICRNLVYYLGTKNITLLNRTEEKAEELANELGLNSASMEDLSAELQKADIILVATNSTEPVILKSHIENSGDKLIIDLSIPYNVEPAAQQLSNITLINVDELSKIKDETLQKREGEIPKAKEIIFKHITEFLDWHGMRRHVPMLKAVKVKLEQLDSYPEYINYSSTQISTFLPQNKDAKIQKVINGMALKLRQCNKRGCHYLEAINEYITIGTN